MQTLYKKTSTGAIQFWDIQVDGNVIRTAYGQIDTDHPQETLDVISKGKNLGRANATTREQQAVLEAKAKWEKQLKKGYVASVEAAKNEKVNSIIEGGILPMLAHDSKKHGHKIKYPAWGQPKLDGIRCIAIKKKGKCTLWTRTRKPIYSVPHIVKEIEALLPDDTALDGELYHHDYRYDFETIISLVRPDEPVAGHEVVQYHIYDTPVQIPFTDRRKWLRDNIQHSPILKLVETYRIETAVDIDTYLEQMLNDGYEGLMLRNGDALYVNKRSYDLQKVKKFESNEFKIVGFEEGRGRLAGHVGSFVCKTKDGKEFLAKQKGSLDRLGEYFRDHSLWEGKSLTVQYQNITTAGVPRFPVGIAIRDYE